MNIAGHEVMVLRLTFVGEMGYELHIPSGSAVAVYEALMRGFDTLSAQGVKVANSGYRAIDSLSAEKGYRHWHADLTNRSSLMRGSRRGLSALVTVAEHGPQHCR